MQRWKQNVVLILILSLMMSWAGSGIAETRPTVVDSLVWDIQYLERELAQCGIEATATEDSLRHQLRVLNWDLEDSRDREMSWYEKPPVWFLLGAAASVLVIGSTVRLTF